MTATKPVHRDAFARKKQPTPHKQDCGPTLTARGRREVYAARVRSRDALFDAARALDATVDGECPQVRGPNHTDNLLRVAAWLRKKAEELNAKLEKECEQGNPSGQQTTFATGD